MKHFLKETDFSPPEIAEIFARALDFKKNRHGGSPPLLKNQTWAMLFYKSSTRTRVSFEVGISELGGNALYLDKSNMQLSRGETVADTAKILSRYVHGLIVRTYDHEIVEECASHGSISVINALTDFLHPCQIYSDAFTLAERWSDNAKLDSLRGRKLAYLGDCAGNMANSWILAASIFGLQVALAGPEEFSPGSKIQKLLEKEGLENNFTFTTDPNEAVREADVVYTDVWASMGDEDEAELRSKKMTPYAVTTELLGTAKPDALFMHCLPAHSGQEVTREVLDCPKSIIFDQAENRLHVQKAILAAIVETNRR